MKPNELMIGNYCIRLGSIHKVTASTLEKLENLPSDQEAFWPIPVNEQTTSHFGIKVKVVDGKDYVSNCLCVDKDGEYKYVIDSCETMMGDYDYVGVDVKYIHQVQIAHLMSAGEQLITGNFEE